MLNVLESTPIAQFAIGMDHTVIYWNRACEQLTGFTAKEMIGTDHQWKPFYSSKRPVLADLIIDDDFRQFNRLYKNKRASESDIVPQAWEATDYFQNLGKKPRYVFFLAAPIYNNDKQLIGAVETLQDITRRVLAENELRSSEERYRALTENVLDGVVLIQDGRVIFSNQALAVILGYHSHEDLLGKKVVDLLSEESQSKFKQMQAHFEKGRPIEKILHSQSLKKDGTRIWVEAHNSIIMWEGEAAILTTIRDVTDTRLKEIAIQEQAEHLRKENERLKHSIQEQHRFGRIIGKSKVMKEVYELILKAAATDDNVIIYGESGTGKELVAREIHRMSETYGGEFVPVNSGAIPESLIEREFFGHKKGAFTGATADTHGYLDLADGGILFLDEIGDLGLNMQVKLLRAIEDGGYTPVGSNKVKKSNFRIIAATNKNLRELVSNGQMRHDFYYRIHVIPIHLPPLRDRKEDIPLIIDYFLQSLGNEDDLSTIPEAVMEALKEYDWPGNVRELQNMLRRYLTVGGLDFMSFNSNPSQKGDTCIEDLQPIERMNLYEAVEDYERRLIIKSLEQNQWHKEKTALALGISRRTLFRKLKNYNLP